MSCPERRESSLYHLVSTLAELPDRFPLILHTIQKKNQQQTNKQTRKLLEPGSLPTIHVIHEADMKYVES